MEGEKVLTNEKTARGLLRSLNGYGALARVLHQLEDSLPAGERRPAMGPRLEPVLPSAPGELFQRGVPQVAQTREEAHKRLRAAHRAYLARIKNPDLFRSQPFRDRFAPGYVYLPERDMVLQDRR